MEVIKKFVNEVEREYSSVKIGYKFDADESEYEIWYYGDESIVESYEFQDFMGSTLYEILHKEKVYNTYFNHLTASEYEKMKSKKPKLNMSRLINKVKGKVPKDHKRAVFQLSKKI